MTDEVDEPTLPDLTPEEWAKQQAEHEISEEDRVRLTAEKVAAENQEAPTEEE